MCRGEESLGALVRSGTIGDSRYDPKDLPTTRWQLRGTSLQVPAFRGDDGDVPWCRRGGGIFRRVGDDHRQRGRSHPQKSWGCGGDRLTGCDNVGDIVPTHWQMVAGEDSLPVPGDGLAPL